MIYKTFDIVVVPFPFTDTNASKNRPAIVLSSSKNFGQVTGHSVMAMITSARNAPWQLDSKMIDWQKAGLPHASVIRMKFFTIDHRFITRKIGVLSPKDQAGLRKKVGLVLEGVL